LVSLEALLFDALSLLIDLFIVRAEEIDVILLLLLRSGRGSERLASFGRAGESSMFRAP